MTCLIVDITRHCRQLLALVHVHYYLRHHPGQGAGSRSLGGGWVEVGGLTYRTSVESATENIQLPRMHVQVDKSTNILIWCNDTSK